MFMPSPAGIASQALVNLASRSRTKKPNALIRSPGSIARVRACCAVRAPSGWAVTPRLCAPVRHLHEEQHVRAFEEDRAGVEEIAGLQAVGLGAEEVPPGAVQMAGSPAVTAQDRPHGRLADAVAETSQFAVHPAGPPGRVLPREPQHQIPDIPAGRWASWPAGIGPCTRGEAAAPRQQPPPRYEAGIPSASVTRHARA